MTDKAEPWALEAAKMPLAFAQVREDPRLDLELARQLPPGADAVMIASGGETAACLGRLPLGRLHLVDMNPAQLALARCKWHLAETETTDSAAALLGHEPMEPSLREWALEDLLDRLGFPLEIFGPMERVSALGPDHAGRYELAFAELRAAATAGGLDIDAWLNATRPLHLELSSDSTWGHALDAAFNRVMALPNLVALFGEQATQNPRQSFHDHFAWRTRETTAALAPAKNPFLWQMFAGRFPPDVRYDWLNDEATFGQPFQTEALWYHGRMSEVLDSMPEQSADLIHLSNILDWLSEGEAAATLQSAFRVLRPKGRTIIRQLNSTLDIPGLPSGFSWDRALGEDWARRDRSFFYPQIHVGQRA